MAFELTMDQVTRIASMTLAGVPDDQVLQVYPMKQEELAELRELDEYKEEFAKLAEKQVSISQGWNELEEKSLFHLKSIMETRPDPDFALRVAAVANKAVRRHGDRASLAFESEREVKLVMNQNFIKVIASGNQQLEEQREKIVHEVEQPKQLTQKERHVVNMLPVDEIHSALGIEDPAETNDKMIKSIKDDMKDWDDFDLTGIGEVVL